MKRSNSSCLSCGSDSTAASISARVFTPQNDTTQTGHEQAVVVLNPYFPRSSVADRRKKDTWLIVEYRLLHQWGFAGPLCRRLVRRVVEGFRRIPTLDHRLNPRLLGRRRLLTGWRRVRALRDTGAGSPRS